MNAASPPSRASSTATPTPEAARAMGASGSPASEAERLAFEAWMEGHSWALCATWDGRGYRGDAEQGAHVCPHATRTRQMWAAWRDRAALATIPPRPAQPSPRPRSHPA